MVDIDESGLVTQVTPVRDLRQWENGGYFVLRPEIFDHLNEGEDLVEDAIVRAGPAADACSAYPYKGYWSPADTVKERAQMEEMYHRGNCPWMVWDPERSGQRRGHLGRSHSAVADAEALERDSAAAAPAGERAPVGARARRAPGRHRDRGWGHAAQPRPSVIRACASGMC